MAKTGMKPNRSENMKEVKKILFIEIIILIIKLIGIYFTKSTALLANSLLDILLIIISILLLKNKNNKTYKNILSSLISFIFILLSLGVIFISMITNYVPSLWVILFVIIPLILRYITSCFYTTINYQKKSGLIGYSNITSNLEFYSYLIIIITTITNHLTKWLPILKYSSRIGTVLIAILLIIKCLKHINNSLNNKIEKQDKIADKNIIKINNYNINYYGGYKKINLNIQLKNNLSLIDLNSFILSLQDYLLKKYDVVEITTKEEMKQVNYYARNSRSRNSKTNTKKQNSKQKNKKR